MEFAKIGNGDKTLVFLHGWNNDSATWLPFIKQFNKSEYSMYLVDLPGFGAPQIPEKVLTIEDYADEVESFVASQKLEKVTLVGHSFGGRVGIVLASREPNYLRKLVLIGTPGISIELSLKNKTLRLLANLFKKFSFIIPTKVLEDFRNYIRRRIYGGDYVADSVMMKIRNQVIGQDLSDNLRQISVPSLIIYGEADSEYPEIVARKIKKLISNSRLAIFSYASHFVHLQKPEIISKMIEDFINE